MATILYVAYSSEDEGHRFPIGQPESSFEEMSMFIEGEIKKNHPDGDTAGRSVSELTAAQLENLGQPDCHGDLVYIYALENEEQQYIYLDDKAECWDWIFVYKLTSK